MRNPKPLNPKPKTHRILVKPWLSIFFLGLIVVISIGLMNLVTAAVLEQLGPDCSGCGMAIMFYNIQSYTIIL